MVFEALSGALRLDSPCSLDAEDLEEAWPMWRFVTWNLDWWQRHPEQTPRRTLLERFDADVVALQEVKGHVAKSLRQRNEGPSVFSQELHPHAHWGWMGCGLLLRWGATVEETGMVEGLPKPQRSLWARITLPGVGPLTVVSWHTPNAAGDGRSVKMAAFAAMSSWLARAPRPVVIGADLNTWIDAVDLREADPEDGFYEEHAFIGPDPAHGLVDAFRTVTAEAGGLEALRTERPEGPLAVSHVLAGGAEHRMDRILVSPDLSPQAGGYELDAARESGSDHALHWIDFS